MPHSHADRERTFTRREKIMVTQFVLAAIKTLPWMFLAQALMCACLVSTRHLPVNGTPLQGLISGTLVCSMLALVAVLVRRREAGAALGAFCLFLTLHSLPGLITSLRACEYLLHYTGLAPILSQHEWLATATITLVSATVLVLMEMARHERQQGIY